MVRTSRCGRDNPGSTPGAVSIEIHNSGQHSHYSLDNGRLKTRNLKPINRFRGKPLRRWLSRSFEIRGSIVLSISACHADDPGSIPGRGVFEVNARVEEDEGFLDVQMFWRLWEWATSS